MVGRLSGWGCSLWYRGLFFCGRVFCLGLWCGFFYCVYLELYDLRWFVGIGYRDGGMEVGLVVRKILKVLELWGGWVGEVLVFVFGGGDVWLLVCEVNCVVWVLIVGGFGCVCIVVVRWWWGYCCFLFWFEFGKIFFFFMLCFFEWLSWWVDGLLGFGCCWMYFVVGVGVSCVCFECKWISGGRFLV